MFRNGSIIAWVLCWTSLIGAAPSLDISLSTIDSKPLLMASQGQPFIMTVTVHDARDIGVPQLTMPKGCQWRQTGTSMYSRNGMQRVSYIYSVRLDEVGDYTLGPVTIVVDGKRLTSPEVPVFVEYPGVVANQEKKKNNEKEEPAFARLTLSKNEAYVQERVKALLRFYRKQGSSIEFDQVVEPDHAHPGGYQIHNRAEPRVGREQIDGSWYDYLEWTWDIYPERAGTLMIPAYKIDYTTRVDEGIRLLGFSFGPQRLVRKSTYSNAVTLVAQELPRGIDPDIIGIVYDVGLKVHPAVLHEGEATTLTFSITTDADIDRARVSIQGIPDGFKSYPSKKQTHYDAQGNQVHDIEYVLQAKRQGEWEIPAQSCCYFDTRTGKVHTRWTAAAPLSVLPTTSVRTNTQESELNIETHQQLAPFWDTTRDGKRLKLTIPWWIVAWVVALMLLALMSMSGYSLATSITISVPFITRWYRRSKACALINNLSKADELYPAMLRAYALLVNRPAKQVSLNEIDQRISTRMTQQEYRDWQEFVQRMSQARYGKHQPTQEQQLLNDSHRWIDMISRIV